MKPRSVVGHRIQPVFAFDFKAGVKWALAEFSAALRYAPMVRSARLTAYVSNRLDEISRTMDLKEVPSGANVVLIEPGDDGVFYGARTVNRVQVTSAVQTYLDLRRERGRGEEAAQAILEQVLRPAWQTAPSTKSRP